MMTPEERAREIVFGESHYDYDLTTSAAELLIADIASAIRDAEVRGAERMRERASRECREIAAKSVRAVGAVTEVAVVADRCNAAIRALDPAEVAGG